MNPPEMDSRPFNAFISMYDTELPVPEQRLQRNSVFKTAYIPVGETPTILSTRLP